jgi:hypothetical protein
MKLSHRLWSVTFAVIIGGAFLITGCGGGNDGKDLTLSGIYYRGGVVKVGADSAWAALGVAEYKTNGTGILSYAHSAFGPMTGLTIAYSLDSVGTLKENISFSGVTGETTNGAVTADKKFMVVIDDDLEDGMRGLEAAILLSPDSDRIDPTGDYFQVGYYDLSSGNSPVALHSVATFNGDGTGVRVYESSDQTAEASHPFTYTVGAGGRLTFGYERAGKEALTLLGAVTSDKSVLGFVDNDTVDGVVGIEVGIRKSSGKSVSSVRGRYHFFTISATGGTVTRTAVIDFDGAGNAIVTGLSGLDIGPVVYTVAADGGLLLTANSVSWKGALRGDNSMFAVASVEASHVSLLIGIAEW